jgi:hypothetical protein
MNTIVTAATPSEDTHSATQGFALSVTVEIAQFLLLELLGPWRQP